MYRQGVDMGKSYRREVAKHYLGMHLTSWLWLYWGKNQLHEKRLHSLKWKDNMWDL